jgi:hypothetical protein
MVLAHLDPPRAWSVGGEQFRWFKSGTRTIHRNRAT